MNLLGLVGARGRRVSAREAASGGCFRLGRVARLRSLVVRGPELKTRLMETYAETRSRRGRRRLRCSRRSSSLPARDPFASVARRLAPLAYLLPPLLEPLSPWTRRATISRRSTVRVRSFSNRQQLPAARKLEREPDAVGSDGTLVDSLSCKLVYSGTGIPIGAPLRFVHG